MVGGERHGQYVHDVFPEYPFNQEMSWRRSTGRRARIGYTKQNAVILNSSAIGCCGFLSKSAIGNNDVFKCSNPHKTEFKKWTRLVIVEMLERFAWDIGPEYFSKWRVNRRDAARMSHELGTRGLVVVWLYELYTTCIPYAMWACRYSQHHVSRGARMGTDISTEKHWCNRERKLGIHQGVWQIGQLANGYPGGRASELPIVDGQKLLEMICVLDVQKGAIIQFNVPAIPQ